MSAISYRRDVSVLHTRWCKRPALTVLDLAFGDGAGFLAVAAGLGLSSAQDPSACLHYVTVHQRIDLPALAAAAFAAAATLQGESRAEWAALAMQLQQAWLPAVPGFQRLLLADGRLILTVVSDALESALPQLDLTFDAVYMDLSRATPPVARWLGRLAAQDALLQIDVSGAGGVIGIDSDMDAKIQAAHVTLTRAGFAAEGADAADADYIPVDGVLSFTFAPRHHPRAAPAAVAAKRAIVIGAGLAGAAACYRLSVRGWDCTLIEQHDAPARQASGNAAGIFMPVLSRDDNPLSRLTRSAFLFALHIWKGLGGVGIDHPLPGETCGVLQMPRSDAASPSLSETNAEFSAFADSADSDRPSPDLARSDAQLLWPWPHPYPPDYCRYMTDAEASAALQRPAAGGWWFPAAGWLQPSGVCEAMLRASGDRVRVLYSRQAVQCRHDSGIWYVDAADGETIASAPIVILANGAQATQFEAAAHLPLASIRGQVTHLPAGSADVPFVICGDAYLTPCSRQKQAGQDIASLGATYDNDADSEVRLSSHLQNIHRLLQMLPGLKPPADPAALTGRVGFRCVTPDRLPLVGALPDPTQLAGSGDVRLAAMPRLPGLYGLLGYGSRGLIWAPLAAELLAAQLSGEPAPLPRDLIALLDPARFALKQRRRAS